MRTELTIASMDGGPDLEVELPHDTRIQEGFYKLEQATAYIQVHHIMTWDDVMDMLPNPEITIGQTKVYISAASFLTAVFQVAKDNNRIKAVDMIVSAMKQSGAHISGKDAGAFVTELLTKKRPYV